MTNPLSEPYRLERLPIDAPDDDPRWAQFVDAIRLPFLSGRATDAGVATFRSHRKADGARLTMVTAEGPGLASRVPVATFNCTDRVVNTGSAELPVLTIGTISVVASHRRRGLLTAMMRDALDDARDRGLPLAALSASEAVIYGRFGFAPADVWQHVDIDTHRFALRPEAEVAAGTLEFVEPATLAEHLDRLFEAHRARHVGAFARGHADTLVLSGQWDSTAQGPSTTLRALAHFDAAGILDGFATFTTPANEEPPVTASVQLVLASDPAVERALWQGLASIDLLDVLSYDVPNGDDSLQLALVDARAWKITRRGDHIWLRLLDLPAAAAARCFAADGSLTLTITDELGYCAGSWLIQVADGKATAWRADPPDPQAPEVRLHVGVLASLWLGGTLPRSVIDAGLVSGDAEALASFATLFASSEQPQNLTWF